MSNNRQECSIIIVPLRSLPIGKLIDIVDIRQIAQDLEWRGDNAQQTIIALKSLSEALTQGFYIKDVGVDAANATFILTRGGADSLLYGQ